MWPPPVVLLVTFEFLEQQPRFVASRTSPLDTPGELAVDVRSPESDVPEAYITFAFAALDPQTDRAYRSLRFGWDGHGLEAPEAIVHVARLKLRRCEGQHFDEWFEVAGVAYDGDSRRWALESLTGALCLGHAVPEYIRASVPSDNDLRMVGRAATAILRAEETADKTKTDPYSLAYHRFTSCDEGIWADRSEQKLLTGKQLRDRWVASASADGEKPVCPACQNERKIWADVLRSTGDARYGLIANNAFLLEEESRTIGVDPVSITVEHYAYLTAVMRERRRREKQKSYTAGPNEGEDES